MSTGFPEGDAIVYCEGAFETTNGKTAHGLVRFTRRYRVVSVIDSTVAGRDAGEVLDGKPNGIPIERDLETAIASARDRGVRPTHLVIGLAPDGGRLPPFARADVAAALKLGLHVDSGLHDLLSDDTELAYLAAKSCVNLRDIRRPAPASQLHFFESVIDEVTSFRIAILGTDSAVGKRTTAWRVVDAYETAGLSAEMIGTGQTAWLQGARYGIIMDCLVNDFVAGEIEHAVHSAWRERRPDVIVVEGQGSLMNPAYPGGFEILAAARPHVVVLQHAPARTAYDGFPDHPLHPLATQIQAVELISGRPVVAITVNHEGLEPSEVPAACAAITSETGLPAVDVLLDGADVVIDALRPHLERHRGA